jgi:hypothetical protein
LWDVVDLTHERNTTSEDVGRGCSNAFERRQHAVEERDQDGNDCD